MQMEQAVPESKIVVSRISLFPVLFALAVLVLLGWGVWQRNDSVLSAESGLGYGLGVLGASCMLFLLTYPLAKRVRWIHQLFALKHWFRIHMLLGVLGPLAILFHSNFHLGSMNSTVALLCMLLVVASGLVGRYFYSKVHMGLYGQKANSQALLVSARQQQAQLQQIFSEFPEMVVQVDDFYNQLIPENPDRMSVGASLLAAPRRWWYRNRFKRAIRKHHRGDYLRLWHESQVNLNRYLDTLRKLAQLSLFERLLSWWHVLHMPFFIMLLVTAVVHVWAVHVY